MGKTQTSTARYWARMPLVTRLPALVWFTLALASAPSLGFAWGHEGHEVIALIAEHSMTPAALANAKAILGGASLEDVASWADDYRRDHPETGPWHYIDIQLADSKIDMARECPDGQCVIAQTERFLSVLRDPKTEGHRFAESVAYGDLGTRIRLQSLLTMSGRRTR